MYINNGYLHIMGINKCNTESLVRILCARLYSVVEIVVMPGEVACCSVECGTLVGVSVFSMCSEMLIMSEISCPLWSSVCD